MAMEHLARKTILILIAVCGVSCSSCGQQRRGEAVIDTVIREPTISGNFSDQSVLVFDSTAIDRFLGRYPIFKVHAGEIARFYHARNYAYAWFEKGLLIEQAGNLANRMLNLQNEGIHQTAPYPKELDSLIHNLVQGKPDPGTELMLTAQYFTFAGMAWQGMDRAASVSAGWYLPRKKVDYTTYLDSLLKAPATAEPVYRQYELLRAYLRKYRTLDERYNWNPLVLPANSLRPGDTAAVIQAIRARLYALEDLREDTLSAIFDPELQSAVNRFQARHGLAEDGLLTTATLAELNVPLKSRITQILVNMERCRWLPVRLDADYLAVNIPEFQLHVYHADSLLWSCKVVVGRTIHQTTLFYGEVKYVVFSPYWDVPPSIVRKEILPALKRHPDYLTANHMQVSGHADGLPIIRQLPGPDNPLGMVKFVFPNSYNIYLHDTPTRYLFGETARAFSHGCIRVEEPVKLAAFLLKGNQGWNNEKMGQAMHAGKERYVTLAHKVPVFIAYLTAFTDRNGRLNFRKDLYQLDGQLAEMLLSEGKSN
jgi:murein L,D-transpeptidase YcbB/YkuD